VVGGACAIRIMEGLAAHGREPVSIYPEHERAWLTALSTMLTRRSVNMLTEVWCPLSSRRRRKCRRVREIESRSIAAYSVDRSMVAIE
jgi:hypothetical protein